MLSSFFKTTLEILDIIDNKDNIKDFDIKNSKDRYRISSNGNMITLLDSFNIRPVIFIGKSVRNHEYISKIVDMNVRVFIENFTSTVNVLASFYDMDVPQIIQTVSSKTEVGTNVARLGLESLEHKTENLDFLPLKEETIVTGNESSGNLTRADKLIMQDVTVTISLIKDGKETKLQIPFKVTASTMVVSTNDLALAFNTRNDENSFFNRFESMMAGAITPWEFMFSSDMMNEYKKSKLNDKNEFLKLIEDRNKEAYKRLAKSGTVGFLRFYQMIIIGDEEKSFIEHGVKGKIIKDKYKDKFLNTIHSLAYTYIDDDHERIVYGMNGQTGVVHAKLSDLDKDKKNSELVEIFKYATGQM